MRKVALLVFIAAFAPSAAAAKGGIKVLNSIPDAYWGEWAPAAESCKDGDAEAIVLAEKAYTGPSGMCDVATVSETPSPKGKRGRKSLPTTAQVARQQAVFLARSLVGYLRQTVRLPFHSRDMGSLVSLADYAAYGTLGSYGFFRGGFLRGHLAHLAHAALYRMHQMDLYGPVRGGVTWFADDLYRAVRPRIHLG